MQTLERATETPVATALMFDSRVTARERQTTVKQKPFYAPEMDALRFGAFLLVFCRHVTSQFVALQRQAAAATTGAAVSTAPHAATAVAAISGQWALIQGFTQSMDFGVCLFFFLSSFLITRLLLMEREATGGVAIRAFYVRRSLRIWPLYFAFLLLVVALSHWVPILHVERARVLACVFFVANWAAVLHGWASTAIQPLWSISVEEQFYVLWPWLARGGRKAILWMSAALGIAALGTLLYLGGHAGTQVTAIWPNTLVQMLFFAGGACTAVLSRPETRRMGTGLRLTLMFAGLAAWTVASAKFHVVRTDSPGAGSLITGYLLVLLGTFLIFSGVAGWSATRIPAWLIHLGRISYGLYVFHVVCLLLTEHALLPLLLPHMPSGIRGILFAESMVAAAALLLTLLCAMLSYPLLERPFLKLKKRFTVVSSRPA